MSVLDKFANMFGSLEPVETIVDFDLSSNPIVDHSSLLFSADFDRDGVDLVLSNFGQPDIRIPNYFRANTPADIRTKDGKVLAGDVVEKLAGPEFPAQYAQASPAANVGAIGQVESVSGDVTVQRASGVREALTLGAKVFTNDVVQTGDGGALSLTFVDGTIFTLAESSRMVLDSLIYDPASSENSGIFNLVEGSFVFIAGEVAKTGGMEVKTPAATMGIRGTTVLVRIGSNNGVTEVEISLNQDPDGAQGQFTITGLDGSLIADVDSIATKWLISPVEGQTREIARTPEELSVDQVFLNQAFSAYRSANQRVENGGEYVETDGGGPQIPQGPPIPPNAPPPELPQGPTEETPNDENDQDDRRGELGSGIDTEFALDTSKPGSSSQSVIITQLIRGGEIISIDGFEAPFEIAARVEEAPFESGGVDEVPSVERVAADPFVVPVNSSPEINRPVATPELLEDGSIVLNGFNISDPDDDILTATITAGSTLTLKTGSGVTILQGTGVNEVVTVIRGTGEQISAALNGATYRPTPDADFQGSLTISVNDGEFTTEEVMTINIIPVQDAPVALADTLASGQNDAGITGNLLANDYDVDTNPAKDTLSVLAVTIDGVVHNLNGGTITVLLASGGKLTFAPDGSYTFDTNDAYASLAEGEIHSQTIDYTLSDGHEAEHGTTVTGKFNITIRGINDPSVVILSADTNYFIEANPPVIVDNYVSITDVDSTILIGATVAITKNFEGGFDILGFVNTPNISGSFDAATGVLTLTGADTIAAYEAALSSVTFENTSVAPSQADRTITFKVDDGGGLGPADTITVTVTGSNEAPIVTVTDPTERFIEDHLPTVVEDKIEIVDNDNPNLVGAEVSIGPGFELDTDLLGFTATGNISGSYDKTTGVLTLTGEDTVANYQTVLRSISFSSTSEDPSETDRVISFQVDDGEAVSNIGMVTVSVTAQNDAPVINLDSIAASAEQINNGSFEEGTIFFSGGSLLPNGSTDIANWTVTDDNIFYVQDITGSLYVEGERAVRMNGDEPGAISTTINTVDGQKYEVSFLGLGDGTLTVAATGASTESYTLVSDSDGLYHSYSFLASASTTTLTFTSTTAGAFGPTVDDITMREVIGGTIQVVEDTPVEISDIHITDSDATPGAVFTVTLSASYGLITVNPNAVNGIGATGISGNGGYSVTLIGGLDEINQTLSLADGVTYTPNLDFKGEDSIEVVVNDGGSSGPGGAKIGTETITLNVQAVNDAPPSQSDIGDVVEGNVTNLTGVQFVGQAGDTVGNSVSNVGDINNDGIDDFAIGAAVSSGESGRPSLSGSVYIIYGVAGENPYATYANIDGEISLDEMAADGRGFELVGAASGDQAGFSVSGGGDLNNDGISDIVVGAYFADTPLLNSGASYVVYGGQNFENLADSTTGEISLGTVGVAGIGNLEGFEFNQTESNSTLGTDVKLTGDLNNDGISDLIVGSLGTFSGDNGGAWVVFGGQDFSSTTDGTTGAFDVSQVGFAIDGFLLEAESAFDSTGVSIDVVSDFNGDGIDDILIGAPRESGAAFWGGASYLIYGGQDWQTLRQDYTSPAISLNQLGSTSNDLQGFKIQSDVDDNLLGLSVSSAGDVDGDGLADLLATAPGNSASGVSGATYLIYGGQNLSGTIATSTIGTDAAGAVDGAVFTEGAAGESITHATALGDIDGDGYSDILVGAKLADSGSDADIGRSYIIYGSSAPSSGEYSLADVGGAIKGFQLVGESAGDLFGEQAQLVGDVNSDGYNDFIVTSLGNDDGGSGAGAAYLLYGSDFNNRVNQVSGIDEEVGGAGRQIIHGTPGDDVISGGGGGDIITTGAGDDVITIGNSFIDFIDAGAGTDTLKFGDSGSFDLTNINDLRLQSIEALNTKNGLVNDVTLGITDIFQISDDANTELEAMLGREIPTSFWISADANDTYTFENGSAGGVWMLNSGLSADIPDYNIYEYVESGSADVLATLAIDDDVTPTIV